MLLCGGSVISLGTMSLASCSEIFDNLCNTAACRDVPIPLCDINDFILSDNGFVNNSNMTSMQIFAVYLRLLSMLFLSNAVRSLLHSLACTFWMASW